MLTLELLERESKQHLTLAMYTLLVYGNDSRGYFRVLIEVTCVDSMAFLKKFLCVFSSIENQGSFIVVIVFESPEKHSQQDMQTYR